MGKNYRPIVVDFLHAVLDDGWTINSVNDGEATYVIGSSHTEGSSIGGARVSDMNRALPHIMGVDESSVVLTKLVDTGRTSHLLADKTVHNHLRIGVLIILGNGADELVADWSYNNEQADREFNKAHDKFTAKWENKEVPSA